jgi:hypothetical protein
MTPTVDKTPFKPPSESINKLIVSKKPDKILFKLLKKSSSIKFEYIASAEALTLFCEASQDSS